MMSEHDTTVARALRSLADEVWNAPRHQEQLEKELARMHTQHFETPFIKRYRIAIIGLILLTLSGGGLAATRAYFTKAYHYAFIIRYQGEIVAHPRVLVRRGQIAACTIGNDENAYTVFIHFDGSTSYEGPPGVEIDLVIEEVELYD